MHIRWRNIDLETRVPFVTAHGGGQRFEHVLLEVEHQGCVGYGEAAPAAYHGESRATVTAALERLAPAAAAVGDPALVEAIHAAMAGALAGHRAARAAIDIACHDWLGRRLGVPLWRLLGGDREAAPPSSYTVAIGDRAAVAASLADGAGFAVLKVKMGDAGDLERLRAVRGQTAKPIRVDANGGWPRETALARLPLLAELGVELLEQPLAEDDLDGLSAVRAAAPLPVVADEPARTAGDLARLAGRVDAVNVKLAKAGGIRPALAMIQAARALGLRVMLGCMVESSIGIAAAAALSPLVDWVDLDGQRLLASDPAAGLELERGRILPPPAAPGLGVELASGLFAAA